MTVQIHLPYALKPDGYLVSAADAEKNVDHVCPSCREVVTLRRGEKRIAHFSHRGNSECMGESAIHKIAKMLVVEEIECNANRGTTITLKGTCEHCDSATDKPIPPGTFTKGQAEVALGDYRVDAAAYRNDEIALCIEVRHTHSVNLEKSLDLPYYWVEVDAIEIIKDPGRWKVIASKLKPVVCASCKDEICQTQKSLAKHGFPEGICTPIFNPERSPYVAALEQCWKCKKDIPVFWWDGVPFCQNRPPEPRPKTIVYRYSKQYGGKYWMNTCPCCHSSQGDNFLFLFEGGVLRNEKLYLSEEGASSAHVTVHAGAGAAEAFIRTVFRGRY